MYYTEPNFGVPGFVFLKLCYLYVTYVKYFIKGMQKKSFKFNETFFKLADMSKGVSCTNLFPIFPSI